ncbi:MAG: LuxR C-terminal-related transcriptional regulator [Desulfobacterales bacterium]|nr:LuxR C-terminal-related transcriptional regulator [Desulfobacterales bacterium]
MIVLIQVAIAPGFEDNWSRLYVAITDVTSLKEGIGVLRASEDKYRKVFAAVRTPIMLVDYDAGITVEVNDGACRLLGLAKTEIVGRHFAEMFSPEESERVRALLRADGKERDLSTGGLHMRHGSGRSVPVSTTAALIEVADVRHVLISLNESGRDEPVPPKVGGKRILQREKFLKKITVREREVLRLIAGGHTNRAISEKLQITEKTVKTHRSRMMQKLDIHRLADLVRFALAAGLSP